MPQGMTLKGLLVAGLALFGVGLERLFNMYLIGGGPAERPVRFLVGVLCTTAGSLLLALAAYGSTRPRR